MNSKLNHSGHGPAIDSLPTVFRLPWYYMGPVDFLCSFETA